MSIDYSEFSRMVECAVKVEQHIHRETGEIHLSMECMLPKGAEAVAELIHKMFDRMMQKISGMPAVDEERYVGVEAQLHDRPLYEYFHQKRGDPKDAN